MFQIYKQYFKKSIFFQKSCLKTIIAYKNIAVGFATNYTDILIDKSAISIYVSFGSNILIGFSTR
jgi:hypothetical protein